MKEQKKKQRMDLAMVTPEVKANAYAKVLDAMQKGANVGRVIAVGETGVTLDLSVMYDHDLELTEIGKLIQVNVLNIDPESKHHYQRQIDWEVNTETITEGAATSSMDVMITEEVTEKIVRELKKSGYLDFKDMMAYQEDADPQNRKDGESTIDASKNKILGVDALYKKGFKRLSVVMGKEKTTNAMNFANYVVYGLLDGDTEYKVSFEAASEDKLGAEAAAFLNEFAESGDIRVAAEKLESGAVVPDTCCGTKMEMLNVLTKYMNNNVVPAIKAAHQEEVSVSDKILEKYYKVMEKLADVSGINLERIEGGLFARSYYKIAELLNAEFKVNSLGDDEKAKAQRLITVELENAFASLEKQAKKADPSVVIDKELYATTVMLFAYKALVSDVGLRASTPGLEKFITGEKILNSMNNNPFFPKDYAGKEISAKMGDRALQVLYKIFGNLLGLILDDKDGNPFSLKIAERDIQSWMDKFGIDVVSEGDYDEDERLFILKDVNFSERARLFPRETFHIMDGLRKEGTLMTVHPAIEHAVDSSTPAKYRFKNKSVVKMVEDAIAFAADEKESQITNNYTGLLGMDVFTYNPFEKGASAKERLQLDKYGVPDSRCFSVYVATKDEEGNPISDYVGTSGFEKINGVITDIINNILVVR